MLPAKYSQLPVRETLNSHADPGDPGLFQYPDFFSGCLIGRGFDYQIRLPGTFQPEILMESVKHAAHLAF